MGASAIVTRQPKSESDTSTAPRPDENPVEDQSLPVALAGDPYSHNLLAASIKNLSAVDPEAAAEQLRALHPSDRMMVVAASLRIAAQRSPEEAVKEAIRFCDEDPSYSFEYGQSLISVLSKTGHYQAALRFVLAEEWEGELGENGSKWLTGLFTNWASVAPHQAVQALELMVDPGLRGEALQAVAAGWAKIDPIALAEYASQLTAAPQRELMLAATLRTWSDADPSAAKAWVDRRASVLPAHLLSVPVGR